MIARSIDTLSTVVEAFAVRVLAKVRVPDNVAEEAFRVPPVLRFPAAASDMSAAGTDGMADTLLLPASATMTDVCVRDAALVSVTDNTADAPLRACADAFPPEDATELTIVPLMVCV